MAGDLFTHTIVHKNLGQILGQSCSVPNPPGKTQSSSTPTDLFQRVRVQVSRQCAADINRNPLQFRQIHPYRNLDQTRYGRSLWNGHLYARRVGHRWLKQGLGVRSTFGWEVNIDRNLRWLVRTYGCNQHGHNKQDCEWAGDIPVRTA